MITTTVKYKITGKYYIDSGLFGPTEVRIILSLLLLIEVLFHNSIQYISLVTTLLLLVSNIVDTTKLLKVADECDIKEKLQSK